MKLGLDPRLPILNGQDYDKQLYTRLYDIFRSQAAAVNAVDEVGAQNTADIAANAAAVAGHATDISTNTAAIAQNAADISTNTAAIAENTADISANTAAIGQNAADVAALKAPTKTGSAQFIRAANEILMTGIVTDLGLEIGDVIQITGSASNNLILTVEYITDANDINVNYAHRNGAGPLSLTNETVGCTIKRLSKWYAAPLGLGQDWVFLTATDRTPNTAYRNTTRRPLMFQRYVNIASGISDISVSRAGSVWTSLVSTASTYATAFSFLVPPDWYYRSNFAASDSTLRTFWAELR